MTRPLVPELHDIGKLYYLQSEIKAALGTKGSYLHQNEIAVLEMLDIAQPSTASWRGIVGHHIEGTTNERELFALAIADHAASGVSRGPEHRNPVLSSALHSLWNPVDRQPLEGSLPHCTAENLRDMVAWLNSEPDAEAFFSRYDSLLKVRPEDLGPPRNTVSLATHCTLVGKMYRFLVQCLVATGGAEPTWSLEGQLPQSDSIEAGNHWQLYLVLGRVAFPQTITRTRDMSAFDLLADQMRDLASDDRVLVATFDQFLAICASRDDLDSLLASFSGAGLFVSWQAALVPIRALASSPSKLRRQFGIGEEQDIEKWWAPIQSNWDKIPPPARTQRQEELAERRARLSRRLSEDYPRELATWQLAERISGPICDVCQLEPATRRWPDDPTDAGPFEEIGERCYALRQQGARLAKLSAWTDDLSCRVMWLYIGLDLDRLAAFLWPLLTKYAEPYLDEQQRQELKVRPPLLLEFQKDYVRFLQDWAESVEGYVGAENIEHVGGSGGLAGNSLLCLRLGEDVALPEFLRLYHQAAAGCFPVCFQHDLPGASRAHIPFRLYLGVSGVKFPFSEHWRLAQESNADLLIHIVGQGSMSAPLPSLPALLAIAAKDNRTALHNLAEVAQISEALADLHVVNRSEEGHYVTYGGAMNALRPFGLSHQDLVMFARILEG